MGFATTATSTTFHNYNIPCAHSQIINLRGKVIGSVVIIIVVVITKIARSRVLGVSVSAYCMPLVCRENTAGRVQAMEKAHES